MLTVPTSPGQDDVPAFFHEMAPKAYDLSRGQKVDNFHDPLAIKFATNAAYRRWLEYDYVRSGAPFPIVSRAFRELLTEVCQSDVQFFDVEFQGTRGAKSTGHHFGVNVAVSFSAIDLDKSDAQGMWNSARPPEFVIWGFRKIVLKENMGPTPYIFREATWRSLVIFNDELQRLCRERQMKVVFTPLEDYGG